MQNKIDKTQIESIKQPDWILDYLSDGSPIFQSKNLYMFTSDSINLAKSVEEKNIQLMVDLCSGSGVVGLEVCGQREVDKLYLVEYQKELADMSKASATLTKSKTNIVVINDYIQNTFSFVDEGSVDVVVCNPPYFKKGSGKLSDHQSKNLARHELKLTLCDVVEVASKLLKKGGSFYLIHLSSREEEIEKLCQQKNLTLQKKVVYPAKLSRTIFKFLKQ